MQIAIERAVVLSKSSLIDEGDLPEEVGLALPGACTSGDARSLADIERDYILAVLAANDGNRTQAAAQLGIGAATLNRKPKFHGTPAARLQATT